MPKSAYSKWDLSPETAKVFNQSTTGELLKGRVPIDDNGTLRGHFCCARYFGCVAAGNDVMSESEHLKEILAHERIWRSLYDRATVVLDRFSQQREKGKAGYWIISDDWGPDFLQIEVTDLRLLQRDAIGALKRVLDDFPGWQIAVWIFALDTEPPLPKMGLLISDGQVFHDLKREYLPEEIRHITYEGI